MSDLGRFVDLHLPEARLKLCFHEYSSTNVPWITGFDDNVVFHEWTEFEDKFFDLNGKVRDVLNMRKVRDANTFLNAARLAVARGPIADDPLPGNTAPVFSDCTSLNAVHANIFSAVEDLAQHLCGTRGLALKTKSLWLGRPDKAAKGLGTETSGTRDTAKERTPDCTLMRLSDSRDTVGRPICAFEIKGPCLNNLGDPTSARGKKASAREICNRFNYLFSSESKDNRKKEVKSTEEAGAVGSTDLESVSIGHGMTEEQWDEIPSNLAHRPVAQVLSYALSVTRGCAFLYNYQVGIAMEIQRKSTLECLHVRVSKPFYRDEAPGPVDAMVTFCLHSEDRDRKNDKLPLFIRSVASMISTASQMGPLPQWPQVGQGGPGEGGSRGEKRQEPPQAEAGRPSKRLIGSVAMLPTTFESAEGYESESRSSLRSDSSLTKNELNNALPPQYADTDEMEVLPKDSPQTTDGQDFNAHDDLSHCTIEGDSMDICDGLQLPRGSLIGRGKSGTTFESVWKGIKVAVKEWNGSSEEGLEDLKREESVLEALKRNCPSLFGSVVPKLFLNYAPPPEQTGIYKEPLIVMKFVGRKILRDEEGKLDIIGETGKQQVDRASEIAIGEDALKGLKSLHSEGFVHGDIDLRNLRVEKVPAKSGLTSWKVRWLDLALANRIVRNAHNPSCMRELRTCKQLFRV